MTTAVSVTTTDKKVEVRRVDPQTGEPIAPVEIVDEGSMINFYVHSSQGLVVREQPE